MRYEPYTTTDLSKADSVKKLTSGYGRTGGDVGCHGGMIPVTAEEYNTLIDTYNADPTVDNYHKIEYIDCDKRELEDIKNEIKDQLEDNTLTDSQKESLNQALIRADSLSKVPTVDTDAVEAINKKVDCITNPVKITLSKEAVTLKEGYSETVEATVTPKEKEMTWKSADKTVATVKDGKITAVGKGSTFVFAKVGKEGLAKIKVSVK